MAVSLRIDTPGGADFEGYSLKNVGTLAVVGLSTLAGGVDTTGVNRIRGATGVLRFEDRASGLDRWDIFSSDTLRFHQGGVDRATLTAAGALNLASLNATPSEDYLGLTITRTSGAPRVSIDGGPSSTSDVLINHSGVAYGQLVTFGNTYASSGANQANGLVLRSYRAGGLGLVSSEAAASLRFYVGGATDVELRGSITATGVLLWGTSDATGGVARSMILGNVAAAPSVNPVGAGILYSEGGALKWRGSAGSVTTIAPA